MEAAYPVKKPKKPRNVEEYTILILQDEDQTAIRKRPEKGLLAGMYEFPWVEGIRTKEEVIRYVKAMGYAPIYVRELERSRHIFTHKEWHMAGYAIRVDELEKAPDTQLLFAKAGETEEKYPMPAAFCAYTRYLNIRLGNERFS
ncbi:MAG: NUDIX domain-containing protein [Lachnospiraceae bacterium]|nr:NUDIX domain-containing protein [Lachnospiraceae bacterium]